MLSSDIACLTVSIAAIFLWTYVFLVREIRADPD